MMLGLLFVLSLQAQNGVYVPPSTIHPGSRFVFQVYEAGNATPPSSIALAVAGREFQLPRIEQPFPPPDELSPSTNAGNVYLVPSDLPLGSATLRFRDLVLPVEVSSKPLNQLYMIGYSNIAFAQQQTGNGPIRRNRLTDPAHPGDRVTLWGTAMDRTATIYAGGSEVPATVTRQTDGLDRIEFTLPDDILASCAERVWFFGSSGTRMATIATAQTGVGFCTHPRGFLPNDLVRLDRGQTVPVADFRFSKTYVGVRFGNVSYLELDSSPLSGLLLSIVSPGRSPPRQNGCEASAFSGFSDAPAAASSTDRPQEPVTLSSGELAGPEGKRYTDFPWSPNLFQFGSETPMWTQAGLWTFRTGREEITVSARAPFRWKSEPDFANYSRERDLVLEWDSAVSESGTELMEFVHVQYADRAVNGIIGHVVNCRAPLSAGRLVVPSGFMRSIAWVPGSRPAETWAYPVYSPRRYRTPEGRYVEIVY